MNKNADLNLLTLNILLLTKSPIRKKKSLLPLKRE